MTNSEFLWQTAVVLALGASGALMCRARLKGQPAANFQQVLSKTRYIHLAVPMLLALPCVNLYLSRHPEVQWDMPGWLQMHWAALSWGMVGGILANVFGFCAMSAIAMRQRWKWGPLCFGVAVLATIQVYAEVSSQPNLPPIGETRLSSDGVILQTTPYTCAPAAGANIAALLGVHTTEGELVELCHTTRDGTFPARVLSGLKELGITGKKVKASSGIRAVHAPAMLFVLGDTHAVVYAGMTGGLAEIWNPSEGKALVPEGRLSELWDGHALEFQRSGN